MRSLLEHKFVIVIAVTIFVVLVAPNSVIGKNFEKLKVVKESVIDSEDNQVIDPAAIVNTADNGFVIVGSKNLAAWAMKIDGHAKPLWAYVARDTGKSNFESKYQCGVTMKDGSVFLAGYAPNALKTYQQALLTHLDSSGKVIREQFIVPENRPDHGVARFEKCLQMGKNFLLLGSIVDHSPGPNGSFTRNDFYWLMAYDADGNILWQKFIPVGEEIRGADEFGPLLATNSGFFFSASQNDKTEILLLNISGAVVTRKQMTGRFLVVQPVSNDVTLQIFGGPNGQLRMITLDGQLNETGNTEMKNQPSFLLRSIFRAPDGSLYMFGSGTGKSLFSIAYWPEILRLDSTLQSQQSVELPHNKVDKGSIWAVTSILDDGGFLTARSVVLNPDDNDAKNSPQNLKRGIMLDFIQ